MAEEIKALTRENERLKIQVNILQQENRDLIERIKAEREILAAVNNFIKVISK